jgi:Rod binding domain-containing protein
MSIHGANAIRATMPQTDLERLKGARGATLEQEKARLKEAARQFEALFSYQLLKTMRATIPENPLSEGVPMAGGGGKEIFTQLFDLEISRKMTGNGQTSLAEVLYRSMEKAVEAQFGELPDAPGMKPLRPEDSDGIPVHRNVVDDLPKRLPVPIPKAPGPAGSIPISNQESSDPIMQKFGGLIREVAASSGVKPELVYAVIKHESDGEPTAVSPKGAKGLMQLMDSTAADYGVVNIMDPASNITGGTRYLRDLLDRFGDLKTALAAYNAGPGTVERYGGVPPYRETTEYVKRVVDSMMVAGELFEAAPTKAR